MPDDEELDCVASKRKVLNWTPLAWLNSLSHHTGLYDNSGLKQSEGDAGLDSVELPTTGAAHPVSENVQS